jgi:hypothetical protein
MAGEIDGGALKREDVKDIVPIDPLPLHPPPDPPNRVNGGKLDRTKLRNPGISITY